MRQSEETNELSCSPKWQIESPEDVPFVFIVLCAGGGILCINLSPTVFYCSTIPTLHSHHSVLIISFKFKGFFFANLNSATLLCYLITLSPSSSSLDLPATTDHSVRFHLWLCCQSTECERIIPLANDGRLLLVHPKWSGWEIECTIHSVYDDNRGGRTGGRLDSEPCWLTGWLTDNGWSEW